MRRSIYLILGAVSLIVIGCGKQKDNDDVVSQRYIHKYGYAVSKDEFETRKYPGQVITLLKNGVTITANYENGVLHGVCTHTFPHSQTVESYFVYNQGRLVKEILYDVTGMPIREEVQLSPTRYSTTLWYADGTPMSIEEYANQELLDGQYFTMTNEVEARVEKGKGERIRRDTKGLLLSRDQIAEGFVTFHQTYYPNGSPESVSYYYHGKLNGEKKTFTATGEPLATKEYVSGLLHGKSTLYKNGTKYLEVYYLDGKKNGLEIHYIDGEVVSQEILWENDKRHGPSKYFVDGVAQVEYYYDGSSVSESKWNELNHIDEMIGQIAPEAQKW
jgi:antitoxin component YwqK of YwqJK toxin-antitoxin module